jgi:hypothetical protein
MEAATWLADRGFGKPAADRFPDAPGIGDFTIVIGDHDVRGNPIIEAQYTLVTPKDADKQSETT